MPVTFDECFQTFPAINPPRDFAGFWKSALESLRRVPVDPRQRMVIKRTLVREQITEVRFKSIGRYELRGQLHVPRKRGRVPGVISFHDYQDNRILDTDKAIGDAGLAHLRMDLRSHEAIVPGMPFTPVKDAKLDPPSSSYPYLAVLDALRAVDYLRIHESIDPNKIAVIGRGFGGSLAAFAAALYPDKIHAMSLERPSFLYLTRWLGESTSVLAQEVREILGPSRGKTKARKALDFLDCLYFAPALKQPAFFTVGLADDKSSPACAFALFNHLQSDKTMDLYPDEEKDPLGTGQRKKSAEFLSSVFESNAG